MATNKRSKDPGDISPADRLVSSDKAIMSPRMDATRKILDKAGGGSYYDNLVADARRRGLASMPHKLSKEVAALLNHKTGITARLWYRLMPSVAAFEWAIKTTKAMAGRGPTTFFLKALQTAFDGGERYFRFQEWAKPFLVAFYGEEGAHAQPMADASDEEFLRAHHLNSPECSGCSACWEIRQRVLRTDLIASSTRWLAPNVETPVPTTT